MRANIVFTLLVIVGCRDAKRAERRGEQPQLEMRVADSKPVNRQMVSISAGEFLGAEKWCLDGTLKVRHPEKESITDHVPITLRAYAIDAEVVSCGEFQRCVTAGRCRTIDRDRDCSSGIATVDLGHAAEFCEWRGMEVQSFDQWQRAARGVKGWTYPRGDEWDDSYKTDQRTKGRGARYVSPDGFVYFLVEPKIDLEAASSYLDRELTRDVDCVPEIEGREVHRRWPVVVHLDEQTLNALRHQELTRKGQFRCSLSTPSN